MAEIHLLKDVAQTPRNSELPTVCTGALVGWTPEQIPLVDFAGNPSGAPVRARATVSLDAARGLPSPEVVLVFEDGNPELPIILGLLQPPPAPLRLAEAPPLEAVVDGRRVVLEAEDEIVLRCGPASITLRRNGRVVVRGAYVETRAEGVNRIKGGSVRIN